MKSQVTYTHSQVDGKSRKLKVFVGMSGGVDSSVSAALLKKEGYDVTGVFIKVWQPEWLAGTSSCTWREDRLDAMRVAAKLDIPFITLDLEKEYKRDVVDYMIEEYKKGRTPNPDVMCNRSVKFGGFLSWALEQGADFVATGHYAQVKDGKLLMGSDANKDQSYFLWTLTQKELSKILFPVGNIEKTEVRKLAEKFALPTAAKKDSQGLCFIGKIDIKEFLSHYIPLQPGNVLDQKRNVIGTHDGAFLYTMGERHGFTITAKTPNDAPVYVVSKDLDKNTITVSQRMASFGEKVIRLHSTNWISGQAPAAGTLLQARSRYREPLQEMKMIDATTVEFMEPQNTLSPGQSLVIYKGGECLGGAVI